jgi:redox-sensitive bicupin YhaK (pirin superfamily)
MGPAELRAGHGLDVRPHPHIGLSTVTYLFDGEILHRDSLGEVQPIRPGAVNWMTAGRGIVHSERTAPDVRAAGGALYGIQSWVALPLAHEETAPSFVHHDADTLPLVEDAGMRARVIAGSLFGASSPVATLSDMIYADVGLAPGARMRIDAEHVERAIYVVSGAVEVAGQDGAFGAAQLILFKPGAEIVLTATAETRLMLLGGEPFAEKRYIYWNFVSSSADRIEQAKADWRAHRFAEVPGEDEFIPLPDEPVPVRLS